MLNKNVKTFDDIKSPIITHKGNDYKKYQGVYWDRTLTPFEKPGFMLDIESIQEERQKIDAKAVWYNKELNALKENEKLKHENKELQKEVMDSLNNDQKSKKGKK